MPAFIAAAKPVLSGSERRRAAGANPRATSRLESDEALSTTTISSDTPRWPAADASESGRSAAESRETTMIDTVQRGHQLSAISYQLSARAEGCLITLTYAAADSFRGRGGCGRNGSAARRRVIPPTRSARYASLAAAP